MTTPRQDLKRLKIIDGCHAAIVRNGAHARIIIRMPGTTNRCATRRMTANGPRGTIITHTVSAKKALVMFKATELLTSMEVVRNG
jgi:uncharacterized metal-binding protein